MSTTNKNYDNWSVKSLKEKCIELDIKEGSLKKFIKKSTLVILLEKYDEEQKLLLKSKSEDFLNENSYISDDEDVSSSEELDESKIKDEKNVKPPPFEYKKNILIGPQLKGGKINIEKSLTTKTTKSGLEDTLDWNKILDKSVPLGIFECITLTKPEIFFTQPNALLDKKLIDYVLSLLIKNGSIYLIKYTDTVTKIFIKYLQSKKFGTNKDITITIKNIKNEFSVFKFGIRTKRNTGIIEKDVKSEPKIYYGIKEALIEEEEVVLKAPGKYSYSEVEFTLIKKTIKVPPKEYHNDVVTGITLEEFRKEIDDDKFIEKFILSIKNLFKYKVNFYKRKLLETTKEYQRLKTKIEILLTKGVSPTTIKEMYPMFDFCAGFIVELEEMIGIISIKIGSISFEDVRNNLIDSIEDTTKGFASIIGREDIKNRLASQLYAFSKSYKTFINAFNNISLLGNAGCGKTAIAKVIGFVFSKSGILATGIVKIVSRADLVGQYIGQTAPRTRGILLETLEGVLFIDEAYQLTLTDGGRDFGPEAITEIVNFLDKYIGMNVVIVAGYEDKMMINFFPSNEGLARRFPYRLSLPNYNVHELTDILIRFIERSTDLDIDGETGNYIYSIISYLNENYSTDDIFHNQAGDMLNLGSSISKTINGSYRIKWIEKNLGNNTIIIKEGLQDFLKMKGFLCL
jgi:hypothetical protein